MLFYLIIYNKYLYQKFNQIIYICNKLSKYINKNMLHYQIIFLIKKYFFIYYCYINGYCLYSLIIHFFRYFHLWFLLIVLMCFNNYDNDNDSNNGNYTGAFINRFSFCLHDIKVFLSFENIKLINKKTRKEVKGAFDKMLLDIEFKNKLFNLLSEYDVNADYRKYIMVFDINEYNNIFSDPLLSFLSNVIGLRRVSYILSYEDKNVYVTEFTYIGTNLFQTYVVSMPNFWDLSNSFKNDFSVKYGKTVVYECTLSMKLDENISNTFKNYCKL